MKKQNKMTPAEAGEMSARQENYQRFADHRDMLTDRMMKLKGIRDDMLDLVNQASRYLRELDRELEINVYDRASAYWIPFFRTALNGGNAIMTDFQDTLNEIQKELDS